MIQRVTSIPAAAVVAAILAAGLALIPGNAPLNGWDEWILTGAMTRWAAYSVPSGNLYDALVPTGYPYPPLLFWSGGALCHFLEPSYLVVRIPAAFSLGLSAGLTALIGGWCGRRWGAWTAGILASLAAWLNFHDTVSLDYPMTAAILLSIWLLLHSLDRHSVPFLCAAFLAAGLACAFKYYGVIYWTWLAVVVLLHPQLRMLTRGRRRYAVAFSALAFPAFLASLDGLTFYFYGFGKTHVAETIRTLGWAAYTAHPLTGDAIRPGYAFYGEFLFLRLGIVVCALAVIGVLCTVFQKNRPGLWILSAGIAWALFAEAMGTKHARYILPAAYVLFITVAIAIAALGNTRAGRPWAILFFVTIVIGQGWLAAIRTQTYLADSARVQQVFDTLQNDVAHDALILADEAPFQKWDAGVLPSFPQPVATPEERRAMTATVLVTTDGIYDLIANRILPGSTAYIDGRPKWVQDWSVLLDIGLGRKRVRVLSKPPL